MTDREHSLRVAALEFENARLRAREADLLRQLEDTLTWRNEAFDERNAATEECARLTEDAAAECGRLRAERDALLAAAQAVLKTEMLIPPRSSDAVILERWNALRAAVAACAPEVKP